ncbi:hypothetical protein ACOQFV_26470 [Nocardiopsis changdeensis]|uniref:Roadblock/LC7 domain-containing protein n=1 Tax=Nocardiopsis changdeensis TaxID=2831969 RepID=A0ABX8BEX6_9ACTN|nr:MULTISPECIES: hypothetical protein [Nocardiopsis]QUX20604.1 hypothetical protein KGD84_19065 [Nocardiopsis changdeensis]QYX36535.1 hypothetical protein K1J57_28520 [Nocardiopsis sp. MT53]
MNTIDPRDTAPVGSLAGDDPAATVHEQIRTLHTDHGFDVVIFASDGRVVDASPALSREAIERCGAIGYALKNLSRAYAEMGLKKDVPLTVERLVVRFNDGALVLLPATDDMWVAGVVPKRGLSDAGSVLARFADRVAPLLPAGTDTALHTLPPVLSGGR